MTMDLDSAATFNLIFYWIVIPVAILYLGLRNLKRTWPWLLFTLVAGGFMYLVWSDRLTVAEFLIGFPILIAFVWALKRRGV